MYGNNEEDDGESHSIKCCGFSETGWLPARKNAFHTLLAAPIIGHEF